MKIFFYNLNNGFIQQEIQMPSEQIFPFGAEGKGGTPPLPRRKREKMPEGIEYPMNKPIIQVFIT
ncbi:MAG TPA: hypothetical protein VLE95_03020 [Chlamydiales bacterium]|nr:hypothetical protein [Chlamydiales bacterium]